MGQLLERFGFRKSSVFTEEDILEYECLTHLNRMEIIKAYYRFCSYEPLYSLGPKNPCYPLERVGELPEFHYNPFKDRMIKVFATSVEGYLTFEDYLDMLSVFSERAPMSLKAEYAFKIYDFDGDDLISMDDLEEILTRLLGSESYDIPDRDIQEVVKTVLKDGDIDEDGNIAFTEFSHVLQRVPDFMKPSSNYEMLSIMRVGGYLTRRVAVFSVICHNSVILEKKTLKHMQPSL